MPDQRRETAFDPDLAGSRLCPALLSHAGREFRESDSCFTPFCSSINRHQKQ
jgi:hypothetical protein